MSTHNELIRLLAERSVRFGKFTLSSGKESDFYVDARLTTMSPEGLELVGKLGLSVIRSRGFEVDAVGGLTLGADPVSYAIAMASAKDKAGSLRAFTVRKEPKTHGTRRRIEGPFQSGDRVVICEDVLTTGGSALSAAQAVEEEGGSVAGVLVVLDREEGGCATVEAKYPVLALTTATDVLNAARDLNAAST